MGGINDAVFTVRRAESEGLPEGSTAEAHNPSSDPYSNMEPAPFPRTVERHLHKQWRTSSDHSPSMSQYFGLIPFEPNDCVHVPIEGEIGRIVDLCGLNFTPTLPNGADRRLSSSVTVNCFEIRVNEVECSLLG
jgi:hypothetical protein